MKIKDPKTGRWKKVPDPVTVSTPATEPTTPPITAPVQTPTVPKVTRRLTVEIPPELHQALRMKAAKEDVSLTDTVIQILTKALSNAS
jgi:hypothetical protein